MTYQDELIMKLQNEGFNHLSVEELQRLARFIEIEAAPLKSEIMQLRAKIESVQKSAKQAKKSFIYMETYLPENWLKEKWFLYGKNAVKDINETI